MKKILVILTSLITLTFTIVVVAVLYLVNLDPNEHKDWIAEKFQEETGRELTLAGNIELSLYPWLGIEVNQATISNAPGFSDEPLLTTEHALVRIKLMPLLDQQYEIDTVLLLGSAINLEIDQSGHSNWESLLGDTQTNETETTTGDTLPLNNIALGGVDIQNAKLNFDDRLSDQHYEISNFNMSTGELVYGQPVQLAIDLNISSTKPELNAQVDFTGTVIYDLDQQQYELSPLSLNSLVSGPNIPNGSSSLSLNTALSIDLAEETLTLSNLEIEAFGTHLAANINAQDIQSQTPSYQAGFNMIGSDLALLFRVIENNELADQILKIDDRSFAFSAALDADMQAGNINLSGLEANLLGANISGDVMARDFQSKAPSISGQLNANGPDLPTLLAIAGQIQGGSSSSLSQYGQQLSRVSDKRFSINANFDADLANGNINAPVFNADLLGFTLKGQLDAQNMNDDEGTVNGELTLVNNNLKEVLSALDQNDLAEVAQAIDLSLKLAGNRDNLKVSPLSLDLILSGAQIPNSPVKLQLMTQSNISLNNDTLKVDEFSLKGLGLDINGNLDAKNISQQVEFNGDLTIATFNLRQLLTQLNQDIPETSDKSTLQSVSAGTNFSGSTSNIILSNFSALLDDSSIKGDLSITDFDSPAIEFAMGIDQINADRYLSPTTETETNTASSDSALPIDSLRALNLNGEFNIGQLGISGISLSDLQMGINAKDGQVKLSPMQANLYEGSYAGDISLDVSNNTPQANINLAFNGVTLEPLMQDFMDASYVSGIGNIDFSLNGSGSDIPTIKRNLNGSGNIALVDGILQGVDVGSVLTQVETMIRSQKVLDVQRGEETAFDNITATIAIDNGNVGSDDLLIQAPGFQVTGRGTLVNLNNDSINYNLLTTVTVSTATNDSEEYDIGGYTLPIACTGTIDSPKCLPDVKEIIASALKQAVGRGLNRLLQDALGVEDVPTTSSNEASTNEQNLEEPTAEPESIEKQLINRALESLFR